ncbi:MAG: HesA/MoeB/ThiF family protein [Thermoplasmata archaeon]|nr:HesA/MoeB/ThiF family protein [Thermoplasmata archaeon]
MDIERYRRQIAIPGFGIEAQKKLSRARVVILGLGGLGSAVSIYLTVAGVGHLKVVDRDKIEKNNLNRQILYTEEDLGKWKAEVAEKRLKEMNSDIEVEGLREEINEDNIRELIRDADAVVDCLDNFETRFLVNRAVVELNKPFFHGACRAFYGQVMTIIPRVTPCLRCIFPESIPKDRSIIGVTAGLIGLIEATEVIKYLTGTGECLYGKILIYDATRMSFDIIEVDRNPDCEVCG